MVKQNAQLILDDNTTGRLVTIQVWQAVGSC